MNVKSPRPMRLTERDVYIFEAIHAFDGILGAHQIMRLRYPDGKRLFKSWRTTRERLSKLYQNGYLDRPDRRQRMAYSDMPYWLTEKSAEIVAGLSGNELSEFRYRKQPRWSMIEHDLAVNNFRLAVSDACFELPGVELGEWIAGTEFWRHPDEVEYEDENGKTEKRKVRPDGFFVVRHFNTTENRWYRFPFVLELDRASEQNPRVANEKVRPGVAYLRSRAYFNRFGEAVSGRWVFVTTSLRRLFNMKRQAEAAAGRDAGVFFFTTLDQVSPETVLTEPIWWMGGEEHPRSLFEDS